VGLRPLVKPQDDDGANTKGLSREHTVLVSRSGLVTVTGGKWTTYRAMAEDVLEKCFEQSLLKRVEAGVTANLQAGWCFGVWMPAGRACAMRRVATLMEVSAAAVEALPGADHVLGGGLTEAMVRFAARHEYARTVEDVLARRSRLLFLDARLAAGMAGQVAAILADETGRDAASRSFEPLAKRYLEPLPGLSIDRGFGVCHNRGLRLKSVVEVL
jgi:glycerol-3-phosphate dehydrogenase